MYSCKKCRGPVPDNETVCPICGWHQDEPIPQENVQAQVNRTAYQPTIRSCPVCGGPVGSEDQVCPVCGLRDPLNASGYDIDEHRRRREAEEAETAARIAAIEQQRAKEAAEKERKKADIREKITAREMEQNALKPKLAIIKAVLAAAILVLAAVAFGMMANREAAAKKTLSGDELPDWTAESAAGDVVWLTADNVFDWFNVTTTTTMTRTGKYSSGLPGTTRTSYRGFAGLETEDGRQIYIHYVISNRDAVLTELAAKFDKIELVDVGEYKLPHVTEPFRICGRLGSAASVINTNGFDSASMAKYNEIKEIPFLDISVTTKTIDVPIEGQPQRMALFTGIAGAGGLLLLAAAVILNKANRKSSGLSAEIQHMRRQMDQM